MIQMLNYISLRKVVYFNSLTFILFILLICNLILIENFKYNSMIMNDSNLQDCYRQCFQTPSCYYFSTINSNCYFLNESSYDNCPQTEICVKMNS